VTGGRPENDEGVLQLEMGEPVSPAPRGDKGDALLPPVEE
jgi:hypothetical protein